MKLGMIGLGRMGSNMVRRRLGSGQECGVFDIHPQAALDLTKAGATATRSIADLVAKLEKPRRDLDHGALRPSSATPPLTNSPRPARTRRYRRHRRWQLVLSRRHSPGEDARQARDPLRRRRYVGWRLGLRARLLPRPIGGEPAVVLQKAGPRLRRAGAGAQTARASRLRAAASRPSKATSTVGPPVPDTSSRWFTTGSSTGSWRRTPKA